MTKIFLLIYFLLFAIHSFWLVLEHPEPITCFHNAIAIRNSKESRNILLQPTNLNPDTISFCQKICLLPSLFKYTIPIQFVYLAEYVINQGMVKIYPLF